MRATSASSVSRGAGPVERNWSNCLIAAAAALRIFRNDRRTLRQKLIPRFGAHTSLGKMESYE